MSTEPKKEPDKAPVAVALTELERIDQRLSHIEARLLILEYNLEKWMLIEKRAENRKKLQEKINTEFAGCSMS